MAYKISPMKSGNKLIFLEPIPRNTMKMASEK
jgi:hypothetical protein